MKSSPVISVPVLAVAALLACTPASADAPKLGAAAPDFTLPAASGGTTVAMKDLLAKNKGVAIVFVSTRCPYSNAYVARMNAIAKDYAAKGIAVVGINSNKNESVSEIAEHSKKNAIPFPILKDDGNKVADLYDARHTPEAYVVDAKGTLVYRGRIDETEDEKDARSPDLRNALDALAAGKAVPVAQTKAFGCSIKRA